MKNVIDIIKEVADKQEIKGQFTNTHSGRGMFGEQCCAVSTHCANTFMLSLAHALGKNNIPLSHILPVKTTTIVYFPGLQDKQENDEDDSFDDDENT